MNTEAKKKRQLSPAQQLKKGLKKEYPLLIVSSTYDTYSMGCSINVDIKNLHYTPYPLEEIQLFCYQYQNVRTDERGEILSGGNRFVHINNLIDNDIQTELDQMFLTYLSIYKDYENIKNVDYNTLIEMPSKHREGYQNLLGNQSYCELPTPPVEIAETIETITPEETSQETTPETKIEMNKIDQIIDTLNANDTVYHYEYQQGKKYLKIYYSMILNDGTIRENNKSILYFYEPETNLLYKANSWKQRGNILMSGNEFLTRNTFPTTTQPKQETETMNTNTTTPDTLTQQELLKIEIDNTQAMINARKDLLIYLAENNINGKIQTATETEILELSELLAELERQIDPRPELKLKIATVQEQIKTATNEINNNLWNAELINFTSQTLTNLSCELRLLIDTLNEIESAINSDFPEEKKQAFIEIKTAELVLTAPPTVSPQNVIELFPRKKKTLDQLRNELNTPEAYQDLIDNFDTYTQEYQNINLHGLQLIRDDYSTKDSNGELSPTYDQWCKFMQSYQELTIELRKLN